MSPAFDMALCRCSTTTSSTRRLAAVRGQWRCQHRWRSARPCHRIVDAIRNEPIRKQTWYSRIFKVYQTHPHVVLSCIEMKFLLGVVTNCFRKVGTIAVGSLTMSFRGWEAMCSLWPPAAWKRICSSWRIMKLLFAFAVLHNDLRYMIYLRYIAFT